MTPRQVFLGTLVVLATLLGVFLFYRLISVIVLLILAIIFASAISPAVLKLNRRLPLAASIVVVYVSLILIGLGIIGIVIPPLVQEFQKLVKNGPQLLGEIQNRLAGVQRDLHLPQQFQIPNLENYLTQFLNQAPTFAAGVLHVALGFVAGIAGITIVLVFAFYWLLERERIKDMWVGLVPLPRREEVHEMIDDIELRLGGYVRGQMTVAVTVAIMAYIGLLILQIPFPLVLAVFSGAAELIPIAGPYIGALPALVVGFGVSPTRAFFVLALFWIIQQLESQLLVPKILQRYVGLSPLTVLFVVLSGAAMLGIIGAMIAVPMASVVHVVLDHTLFRKRHEDEFLPLSPPRG